MSNYDRYTNYKDDAGVSGVVFGANKTVLEVELNEMQEIQKTHLRNVLHSMIGDGTTNLSNIKYTGGKLIITDSMFSVDGIVVQCDSLSLSITNGSAYLQVWEEDADYTSTLKKNGNQQNATTVNNWFKDTRCITETTRRKVVKYNLASTTDPTKHNLKIADFSSSVMTLTVKEIDIARAIEELQNQFDNLQIGGRNLALNTSNTYTDVSYTPDAENASTFLYKVLNDGFNVGDTMLIRLIVKYTNVVSSDGKQALLKVSGNGDVTNWTTGYLEGSKLYNLEGSGEIEILHKITIKEEHLKNSCWDLRIVYWSIKSGTLQIKNVKVENSTKPSSWTPAPEDFQNPTFDDSGTVATISSFADFANSVKSKMNIFEFFRNFKAGLKYIVHTGKIVNSQDVTEEGFVLDARQANPNIANSLGAQISNLNNNIANKLDKSIKTFSLNKKGWYRIACLEKITLSTVQGGSCYSTLIFIKTNFGYSTNIGITALLNSSYMKSNITVLGKSVTDYAITKIRHVVDSTQDPKRTYIEIFYDKDVSNGIQIELFSKSQNENEWKFLSSPEQTEESVSGVEIYSSADLKNKEREVVLNSDLKTFKYSVSIDKSRDEAVKELFYSLPNDDSVHTGLLIHGQTVTCIVQKYPSSTYGSVLMFGYSQPLIRYAVGSTGWTKYTITETQISVS